MIRAPAVAGQFYASTKPELVKQLDACFKSKLGPGILKKAPTKKFPMVSAGIESHWQPWLRSCDRPCRSGLTGIFALSAKQLPVCGLDR